MRVAYVISEYPKLSHTFVTREIQALRARGVEVETITIRRTPEAELLTAEDREEARRTFSVLPADRSELVRAHLAALLRSPRHYLATFKEAQRLAVPGLRGRLWALFYFVEAVIVAARLRKLRVGHVHAHFVNVAASVAHLAAFLRGDIGWSFTMHGPLEFDDVTLHAIPEKTGAASFVACISDFARAQLMRQVPEAHWDKLHVVHCGVRPADYDRPERTSEPGRPLELVAVGRLAPMKGFPVLFEAFRLATKAGVDARLTLVGGGELADDLVRRVQAAGLAELVRFTGPLPPAAVTTTIAQADVFCLPSFAEGVPVVLMEAMATGLPVIATRLMGIPELVEEGVSGLLVPPGRPDLFADAIVRLAADSAERARMGEAGRAAVRAGFDVEDAAAALKRLFESVPA